MKSLVKVLLVTITLRGSSCLTKLFAIFFLFYSIHRNKQSYYFLTLAIPGIWIVLRISTAEIIANTLILTSYFFIQHKKVNTSFLFLMLACLTKETMIIFFSHICVTLLK